MYSDGAEALTHCVEIIFEGLLSVNFLCLFFTKCFLNFVSKPCFQKSAKLRGPPECLVQLGIEFSVKLMAPWSLQSSLLTFP